jgi:hypothetical protein
VKAYAIRADNDADKIVDDYLKRSGGVAAGFTRQRHENRLWREIRKALQQAFKEGRAAGKKAVEAKTGAVGPKIPDWQRRALQAKKP